MGAGRGAGHRGEESSRPFHHHIHHIHHTLCTLRALRALRTLRTLRTLRSLPLSAPPLEQVQRDAFGHVKLDSINPGKYFADTFSALIGAEKVLGLASSSIPQSRTTSAPHYHSPTIHSFLPLTPDSSLLPTHSDLASLTLSSRLPLPSPRAPRHRNRSSCRRAATMPAPRRPTRPTSS